MVNIGVQLLLLVLAGKQAIVTPAAAGGELQYNTTCAVLGCHFFERDAPCACNDECTRYKDCCKDYEAVCGGGGGGGGGPA